MSNALDPFQDQVVSILLGDGWHRIRRQTFSRGSTWEGDRPGFSATEQLTGRTIMGPIETVAAVRLARDPGDEGDD